MNLLETAKILLAKGLLLRLVYNDDTGVKRYRVVLHGRWLNILGIQDSVDDNAVYDVYNDEIINVDDVQIDFIEYISTPPDIPLQDLLALSDGFLEQHHEYITSVRKRLLELKLAFKQEIDNFINPIANLSIQDQEDMYFLIFYPARLSNASSSARDFKQRVKENYLIYGSNNVITVTSTIQALSVLGIPDKSLNITDESFIQALKRQWFRLINEEKKIILRKLELLCEEGATDAEFLQEMKSYKLMLDEIDADILDNSTTVSEIISFWPDIIQPRPFYVYAG